MIKASGASCTSDSNPCTSDVCNGADPACHHPNYAAGTSCENSDGVVCTADVCDGSGKCISTPQDYRCDDGNDCSDDWCNPGLAPPDGTGCVHVARTSVSTGCYPSDTSHPNSCGCNDRNPCTKFDRCQQDMSGSIYCAGDNLPDNTQCSAGTTCASAAMCKSGVCTPTGFAPAGTACDDHNVCTGTTPLPDACDGNGKCLPGPLNSDAPCDDGNECSTGDHCAMVAVSSTQFAPGCIGVPAAGNCDDGDACTGDRLFGSSSDTCQSGGCQSGASETAFCKQWGKTYYATNSGHCRSTDGACCTNCANNTSGVRCNCCLPRGMNCIGGGTPCCSGTVGNVVMTGTCGTPTGPAGTGVVGVCQ
ncbi:MAG: hypothetical protein E6J68_08320 [Deltaproteobacteria bacterium]|nr:MAG: hypothetical protein E6J68_08320 [Deltaproteobacteria bacterium]